MVRDMRILVAWISLLLTSYTVSRAVQGQAQTPTQPPKLAVILVVDQMRADYVDRFQSDWTAGLHRMVTKGAWFTRAAFPYLTTVTCPGHATISTGAFPAVSGIFQNTWFDRTHNAITTCTDDANVKPISYGRKSGEPESPAYLLVPSFADLMRLERNARVVTLSLKARSAIMLAGHGGDAVTWMNESVDTWQTSTAFARAPVPQVQAFVSANPVEADYGRVWERQLPLSRYQEQDDARDEAPPKGWSRTFPHVLKGDADDTRPDEEFYGQWLRSPFADAYLGRMAASLVESMQLGKGDRTDVLAVSFSSPDSVGHAFGPDSHEIQDMYSRLDGTVGTLLDRLDALVGPDQYVVALSADHGVTNIPEQWRGRGKEAGRINARAIADLLDRRTEVALGPGRHVSRVNGNDVYFAPGVYAKLTGISGAIQGLLSTVTSQPGMARAFSTNDLRGGRMSPDALLRAAALSYVPGRSGDFVLVPKPGWMFAASGTTHGTATAEDQQVPIILFGRGIKQGQYAEAATPADVAPTLALLCGITMPQAEGRPLRSALQ
jgi:predicted AlkP superfamily pyrophosphatase or phosphodiesterase